MINKDLAAFIIAQRTAGVSDADISTALIGRGWNANEVRAGLAISTIELATPPAILPGVGMLLDDAFKLFRKRFTLLFLVWVPVMVLSVVMGFVMPSSLPGAEGALPVLPAPGVIALAIIGGIASVIFSLLAGIAGTLVVSDETITSPIVALERALPILPRYLVTSILVGLWIFVGFLLLIVPGIIFSIQYTFAALIAIIEGKKATEAMAQSKTYVKGRWGAIATRVFLGMLVIMIPSMVIGAVAVPLSLMSGGAVVSKIISALANAVIGGFVLTYMYILYLRVKGS